MPHEYERRWLVQHLPLLTMVGTRIVQGYLSISTDGQEVRLRRKADTCYLTTKSGDGLIRREFECTIPQEVFDTHWPATEGRQLEKMRHTLPHAGHLIELDLYEGALASLAIAEVEFADTAAAAAFVPPEWFEDEVTDDVRYRNRNLAVGHLPDRM